MEKVFERFKKYLEKFEFFGKLEVKNDIEGRILSLMLLEIDGEGNLIKYPKLGGLLDQPADWMEVLSYVVNSVRKRNLKQMEKLK